MLLTYYGAIHVFCIRVCAISYMSMERAMFHRGLKKSIGTTVSIHLASCINRILLRKSIKLALLYLYYWYGISISTSLDQAREALAQSFNT